ncbi:DUF4199 domain-containing protein [Flavobacterium alkalisoli]|uniref:DUF4199 domain-containing protein n=1 Tax=Flavobacterium alkalisoli TaxID=2602769 RepID=A0A5B9FTY2_9FLAO|nr:DUF4199 domain-containing protein [Flavobacterium alkalisoli]QEE49699.1 DUF4199 domain-containing protein [Flavobacterium alkalisoli]
MTEAVKKNGINFGVILGVIFVLCYVAMYSIDLKYFVNMWLGIGIIFLGLIVGIISVVKAKVAQNGFISFKQAFTTFFITLAIGLAISTVFNIILLNFIDPAAKDVIRQHLIDITIHFGEKYNAPVEQLKQQVESIKNTDSYSVFNMIKSYFFILVLYIIIGLIVAAAFKKTPTHEQ